jgi:glycosyltransferase involved in cell wall biosynthesis
MKILSVLPYNVYPAYSGGQLRIHNICEQLSKHNVVEQFVWVAAGPRAIRSKLTVTAVNKNYNIYKHESFLVRVFTRIYDIIGISPVYSFVVSFFRNKKFKELVKESDVIIIEHPWLVKYAYKIRNKYNPKAKLVLDSHNAEYLQTCFAHKNNPVLRLVLSSFVKSIEKSALQKSNAVVSVTQDDLDIFAREFKDVVDDKKKKNFFVMITGAHVNEFRPVDQKEKERLKERLGFKGKKIILFCGGRFPTNTEAVRNIIEIAIQEKRKDLLFLVVGSVGEDFKRKKYDNVVFTGFVKDVKPYFKVADLAINPCISGSGFNGKMIEYFAAGLPVISTKHGTRGIDFKENVVVCELEEFDKNIMKILASSKIYKRMSSVSLGVAKQYDWPVLVKELEKRLISLQKHD